MLRQLQQLCCNCAHDRSPAPYVMKDNQEIDWPCQSHLQSTFIVAETIRTGDECCV